VVFLVGVAAAFCLGLGYVLQQRVAARSQEPSAHAVRLLLELMHHKVWWAGIGMMVLGQLLGGLALQLASVALVEPLLSANLLFAFVISAFLSSHRVRWHEVLGALLVSAALGVFIAIGDPQSSDEPRANRAAILLAIGVVAGVVAVIAATGMRRGPVGQSVLFATAAGLLYGLQDVSTRATLLGADDRGVGSVFLHAWVYVVIGAAVVGIALSQSAFKAARLDHSLPPIAAAEPIAGIALGIALLGDTVSMTVPALAAQASSLVAMIIGVVFIGRSRSLAHGGVDAIADQVPQPAATEPAATVADTDIPTPAGRPFDLRRLWTRPRSDDAA
jgi:drug/metabolite transporter (DMT)-like permease